MNEKVKQINPYELIEKSWKNVGFDKYAQITKTFQNVDVLESLEFQRRFNGFYRVRRNKEWQKNIILLCNKEKRKNSLLREFFANFIFKREESKLLLRANFYIQ